LFGNHGCLAIIITRSSPPGLKNCPCLVRHPV
jgi:hypothetical protein